MLTGAIMADQDFDRTGWVSVWIGTTPPPLGHSIDTLKDLCGVHHYRLRDQESDSSPTPVPIRQFFEDVSYSDFFVNDVIAAAKLMSITKGYWMTAQFDFAYDPARVHPPAAQQPVFVGAFRYVPSS